MTTIVESPLQPATSLALRLDPNVITELRNVPHFCDSQYRDLDIPATLEYFRRRYIEHAPIPPGDFAGKLVADIGCGYGWLAMVFAAYTPARVVAIEIDAPKLRAGARIAELLGLADRIEWRVGSVTDIPLGEREADLVYCIEVVEHVGGDPRALQELQRVTDSYLVLTTPNLLCPVIGHDTRLPFCHWLKPQHRDLYAALFRRSHLHERNIFWSPFALTRHLNAFRRVSGFLHYQSFEEYLRQFPYYSPYNGGKMSAGLHPMHYAYLWLMWNVLGRHAHLLMPNLAGTFMRRPSA